MFYVYVYLDPRTQGRYECSTVSFLFKPFYVGKGSGDRWQIHLRESDLVKNPNTKKVNLIRKLTPDFNLRDYVVRISCESEADSLALEIRLIRELGRNTLTNLTDGGVGHSGGRHSDEFRSRIRVLNSRPKPDGFGAKVSATKKGRPLTPSHRKALSGRTLTEEHKAKLRKPKRRRHGIQSDQVDLG